MKHKPVQLHRIDNRKSVIELCKLGSILENRKYNNCMANQSIIHSARFKGEVFSTVKCEPDKLDQMSTPTPYSL